MPTMVIHSSPGNILLDVTLVTHKFICLIETFTDHEGNTSTCTTMMTIKVITISGKLLPLTGRHVGHLQSKILRTLLLSL